MATTFIDSENDVNVNKPPTPSLGWSKDGQYVLLSDGWDLWKVPAKGGAAVNLTVMETDPGFKGDTATGATKYAMTETGLRVSVPLFVNTGDRVKVDTRTGKYLERA